MSMFNRDTQANLNVIFNFFVFLFVCLVSLFFTFVLISLGKKCKMAMKNINFQRYAAQTL